MALEISVIFTTYNEPEWLEKVVWGFSAQIFKDFEVVIADDGSTEETKAVIERLRKTVDFPIQHVWHEDIGFRKCDILNKAIVKQRLIIWYLQMETAFQKMISYKYISTIEKK